MSSKVLGFDEAGEGDVLVLVHGFPFDRRMWEFQVRGLSSDRRVVAVDLRGRGKSPEEGDGWTMETYARDVAATVDSLGVDQVDIAGMSMGGYVVMAFFKLFPEKVRSLIFIDTKAGDDAPEAKEAREKTAALVREKGTLELANGLLPKLMRPEPSEEVSEKARQMFADTPAETAAADALAMRDREDSTSLMAGVSVPTLVLHGELDQLMPLEVGTQLAGSIPRGKLVPIPDAGHLAPMENPAAVNAAIAQFLG